MLLKVYSAKKDNISARSVTEPIHSRVMQVPVKAPKSCDSRKAGHHRIAKHELKLHLPSRHTFNPKLSSFTIYVSTVSLEGSENVSSTTALHNQACDIMCFKLLLVINGRKNNRGIFFPKLSNQGWLKINVCISD